MDCQVLGGGYQGKGIVGEVAEPSIATVAQQSPDLAGHVIVVDGELL
jgi:hypothetical protein